MAALPSPGTSPRRSARGAPGDALAVLNAIRTGDLLTCRIPKGLPPRALALSLSQNTNMTQLILSGNAQYSLEEFCLILEALSNNETLRTLDVSDMDLDGSFLVHVAEFVDNCPTLGRLVLSNNDIDEAAAAAFGRAFVGHQSLHTVAMDGCNMGNEGLLALINAITTAEKDLQKEQKICAVNRYNLNHNNISETAAEAFKAALIDGSVRVVRASFSGNFVPNVLAEAINAKCRENAQVTGVDPSSRPASMQAGSRAVATRKERQQQQQKMAAADTLVPAAESTSESAPQPQKPPVDRPASSNIRYLSRFDDEDRPTTDNKLNGACPWLSYLAQELDREEA